MRGRRRHASFLRPERGHKGRRLLPPDLRPGSVNGGRARQDGSQLLRSDAPWLTPSVERNVGQCPSLVLSGPSPYTGGKGQQQRRKHQGEP